MKIICNRSKLLERINIVLKAVSSKSTMPILSCLILEVNSDIKLITTDMELGIETVVEGEIIEPGKIALDAKFFSEIKNSFFLTYSLIFCFSSAYYQSLWKRIKNNI